MKWWCLHLVALLAAASPCLAEEVEFPEEELARDTVLPVFENSRDVLDRHINTAKRFEIGAGAGMEIDEPFYSDYVYGGHLGYHVTDQHSIAVEGMIWSSGMSSYGNQIRNDTTLKNGANQTNWDASKAPHPLWGVLGNYEFTAYYGKISITKSVVLNLNLLAYGGGLYINMAGYNSFGGDVGIAQNFFISPNWAIRFDIRMLIYQAPNAATIDLYGNNNPPVSGYQSRIFFNNQVGLNLIFLM